MDKDYTKLGLIYEDTLLHEEYRDQADVNGFTIIVGEPHGQPGYGYEIYIPQVKIGRDGVHDQVLRTGDDPDVARDVFDNAVEMAGHTSGPNALYKEVEEYIVRRERQRGEEEEAEEDQTRLDQDNYAPGPGGGHLGSGFQL